MKISISTFECDILLQNAETQALGKALRADELVLAGTNEQFDAMREACSDLLQRIGFNEQYFPTAEGRALESLIDKLLVT